MDDRQLVEGCLKGQSEMQKLLYDKYSSKLFTVCRRYTRDDLEAEDVIQEGFVLVFSKLDTFGFKGSLYNWMRTVMVNVALRKLQKKSRRDTSYNLEQVPEPTYEDDVIATLSAEEIITHVQQLPDGYRNVFNLYVIEGYKHNEIAKLLDIGESTSRSQLTKARRMLQKIAGRTEIYVDMKEKNFDRIVQDKLASHESNVPDQVWSRIEKDLKKKKSDPYLPFILSSVVLAIAAAIFIFATDMYKITSSSSFRSIRTNNCRSRKK